MCIKHAIRLGKKTWGKESGGALSWQRLLSHHSRMDSGRIPVIPRCGVSKEGNREDGVGGSPSPSENEGGGGGFIQK